MENAQRDARQKAADLQKLTHEYEKLRDIKEQLARENKKLNGKDFSLIYFPRILPIFLEFYRIGDFRSLYIPIFSWSFVVELLFTFHQRSNHLGLTSLLSSSLLSFFSLSRSLTFGSNSDLTFFFNRRSEWLQEPVVRLPPKDSWVWGWNQTIGEWESRTECCIPRIGSDEEARRSQVSTSGCRTYPGSTRLRKKTASKGRGTGNTSVSFTSIFLHHPFPSSSIPF